MYVCMSMYESPFTSYFFVKNRLKMLTEPKINITKKFAILLGVEPKMSRD